MASAATPASRTRTTWPGNSRSCSRARAGADLLDTYDAERRPVAELTVEQAYTRYVLRLAPELGKENLQPLVSEATVELGYRYRSSAVLSEADDDDVLVEDPARPSARPGTRAPHLAVIHDGSSISVLDLMGRNFVLMAGSDGAGWCDAAAAAGALLGIPVDAYRVGDGFVDDLGRFEELYGIGPPGLRSSGRTGSLRGARTRQARTRVGPHRNPLADPRPLGGGRLGSDDRCACRERL